VQVLRPRMVGAETAKPVVSATQTESGAVAQL